MRSAVVFHLAACLLVAATGAAIYSGTLDHEFVFDDTPNIVENEAIHWHQLGFAELRRAVTNSYARKRPLANLSFGLNYYFGGLHPRGFRLVNIGLHVVAGWLLYAFALQTLSLCDRRLRNSTGNGPWRQPLGPKAGRLLAAGIALVWVAHPVHTQAVIYIVQRMTVLATVFYLAGMCAYVRGRLQRGRRQWLWFASALVCWLLALASKEIAVTLPVAVLLYEWLFLQNARIAWLQEQWRAFAALGAVAVVIAVVYLEGVAAAYVGLDFTPMQRVMTQWRVLLHYLTILVWPLPQRLILDHDVTLSETLFSPPQTVFAGLLLLAGFIFALRLTQRQPLFAFCILWFYLTLALESTLIPLEMVHEHRLYLPAIGVILGALTLLAQALRRWPVAPVALVTCAVGLLCAGTLVRSRDWRSRVSIWQDCVAKCPANPRPYCNLGEALRLAGDIDGAVASFEKAIELDPDYRLAHNNLGVIHPDPETAMQHFRRAIELSPLYADAYSNLGVLLRQEDRFEEAETQYRKALSLEPGHDAARGNLAELLAEQGRYEEALATAQTALAGDSPQVHIVLGRVHQKTGDYAQAISEYLTAQEALPDKPLLAFRLAQCYVLAGQGERAEASFKRALALSPRYVEAHNELGRYYYNAGQPEAALEHWQEASELAPDHASVQNNLGTLYASSRRYSAAVAAFQRALELDPDLESAKQNLTQALKDSGNAAEAVATMRRFLGDESDAAQLSELGLLELQLGDFKLAAEHLRAAAALDAAAVPALELGIAYARSGDPAGAAKVWEAALAAKPDQPKMRKLLGDAMFAQQRWADAIAQYRAALDLAPETVAAWTNLGAAYLQLKEYNEAVAAFESALVQQPDYEDGRKNLAQAKRLRDRAQ